MTMKEKFRVMVLAFVSEHESLTYSQIAMLVGVHRATLIRWILDSGMPRRRRGGDTRRRSNQ